MNADFIDPVIFTLPFNMPGTDGPMQVRWYGMMYFISFWVGSAILGKLSKTGFFKLPKESIDKYVTYLLIGMILGARIFYVFIYNWGYYSNHLSEVFLIMQGGLSFHGAVVGMSVATLIWAKKHNLHFFQISDCLGIAGSIGLFFGRMGNFINGELYGRVTTSSFGMVFKNGGPMPRHPSQLYEGFFEGIVLFCILVFLHRRVKVYGIVSAVFIMGYGFFRYFIEFFREADSQLGYYFGRTTTMGQILCIVMFLIGLATLFYAKKKNIRIDINN